MKAQKNILKNAMKNIGVGEVASVAFGGKYFLDSYNRSQQEGYGKAASIASGTSDALLSTMLPMKAHLAIGAAKTLPKLAVSGYESMSQQARSISMDINKPFATSTFVDNQQIYTMRQAGMSLAEKSKYNLQQTLMGNEAQHFHR